MMTDVLALAAAAMLPVTLLDVALRRKPRRWRIAVTLLVLVALLVPFGERSAAFYIRGAIGNLSIGSMAMMAYWFLRAWGPPSLARFDRELVFMAVPLLVVAAVFYPMSLGFTVTDPYAHGYYPTVLSAFLLSIFCWAVLSGWYLSAAVLASAFIAFAFGWLESDNFWDYLFDPLLVVVAIVCVVLRGREFAAAPWASLFPRRFTIASLVLVAVFLAFAVVLSRANPTAYIEDFSAEDHFIEWFTSLVLFGAFCVSVHRLVVARHLFSWRGKAVLAFVALLALFGAGEEISWGQRVFDIETPAALKARNAQEELNLHNLTFEFRGEVYKVNKVVFGRGLTLALLFYLLVMTPLHRRNPRVRSLIDSWAIPMPALHHVAAYIVVVLVVELLVETSRRGEMTEFGGAIVFMLNVVFPANRAIYRSGPTSRTATAAATTPSAARR